MHVMQSVRGRGRARKVSLVNIILPPYSRDFELSSGPQVIILGIGDGAAGGTGTTRREVRHSTITHAGQPVTGAANVTGQAAGSATPLWPPLPP